MSISNYKIAGPRERARDTGQECAVGVKYVTSFVCDQVAKAIITRQSGKCVVIGNRQIASFATRDRNSSCAGQRSCSTVRKQVRCGVNNRVAKAVIARQSDKCVVIGNRKIASFATRDRNSSCAGQRSCSTVRKKVRCGVNNRVTKAVIGRQTGKRIVIGNRQVARVTCNRNSSCARYNRSVLRVEKILRSINDIIAYVDPRFDFRSVERALFGDTHDDRKLARCRSITELHCTQFEILRIGNDRPRSQRQCVVRQDAQAKSCKIYSTMPHFNNGEATDFRISGDLNSIICVHEIENQGARATRTIDQNLGKFIVSAIRNGNNCARGRKRNIDSRSVI